MKTLGLQLNRQIPQPGRGVKLVQAVERHQSLKPAELPPIEQRLALDYALDAAQIALDRRQHALIPGCLVILGQYLERQQLAPQVIVIILGPPAGLDHGSRA